MRVDGTGARFWLAAPHRSGAEAGASSQASTTATYTSLEVAQHGTALGRRPFVEHGVAFAEGVGSADAAELLAFLK